MITPEKIVILIMLILFCLFLVILINKNKCLKNKNKHLNNLIKQNSKILGKTVAKLQKRITDADYIIKTECSRYHKLDDLYEHIDWTGNFFVNKGSKDELIFDGTILDVHIISIGTGDKELMINIYCKEETGVVQKIEVSTLDILTFS